MRRTAKHVPKTLLLTLIFSLLAVVALVSAAFATDALAEDATIDDPDAALEELFSTDAGVNALQGLLEEAGRQSAEPVAGLAATPDDELTAMGSADEPVGRLKILARYNDDMQFYDGHVYLLFTSYQDGVTFTVDDIYGAYAIDRQYYTDIAEDISNGSNHTGSDAEKYFTFDDSLSTMTLNRGEIVTIGMYRGFDLSVPQAALGSIQNSTAWTKLSKGAKTAVVKALLQMAESGSVDTDGALDAIRAALPDDVDINQLLDGVVEGGVCFNRELYNQKLEWDQYENVTYERDITLAELNKMALYLTGNLNKFSILKNSCATVALRAWNSIASEEDQLVPDASGIYRYIDAPKSVRDAIRDTFGGREGYYFNNAEGGAQADPEAGYTDDTGWVYVSAPEPVGPITYTYTDENMQLDADQGAIGDLVSAARQDKDVWYHKDHQEILVSFDTATQGDVTTIKSVSFDVNGTVITLDEGSELSDGIWFKVKVDAADGTGYYATDADGNELPSSYSDGWLSFRSDALPASYKIVPSTDGARSLLATTIVNGDKIQGTTKVYCLDGGEQKELGAKAVVTSGTKVYIKSELDEYEWDYMLSDITLNGTSILDAAHFDEEQAAYVLTMPESSSKLVITYEMAYVFNKGPSEVQVLVGQTMDVADYAYMYCGDDWDDSDKFGWQIVNNDDGVLAFEGDDNRTLAVKNEGLAILWAAADGNDNIGVLVIVHAYKDFSGLAKVTFEQWDADIIVSMEGEEDWKIPSSDYYVELGSHLTVVPTQENGTVVSSITANGVSVALGEQIVVNEDVEIKIEFANASIEGMPTRIDLAATGDTYQLQAEVRYADSEGQSASVYDPSITYESSSSLVTVDENGLITVVGEVPEGGKAVIVTAYAGSSNKSVFAKTKVVVGDYDGDRIVGRLTIHARPINSGELIAHGCVTFTTYEDTNLDVSYCHYYEPGEAYKALMEDYRDHPENYSSDPALYNNNELGLEDRESYFNVHSNGAESAPESIAMRCGESITVSNYSHDASNAETFVGALVNGDLGDSDSMKELARQYALYVEGSDDFDGAATFDSLLESLVSLYTGSQMFGENLANGHTLGGVEIDRELYNQFRRNDSQMPNSFYTVEITADELAALEGYLSDPSNNYYSLFTMNCGSAVAAMWNTALADRPELKVSPSYTRIADDPESLYFELIRITEETGKYYDAEVEHDWGGGTDFYPRTVGCPNASTAATWKRLFGAGRYDTMASVVKEGFRQSKTAVLASGANFPDALMASSVAGALRCPVILTKPGELSAQAKDQIERLGVEKVYVMGGDAAVSYEVDSVLDDMGIETWRVEGENRQGTSAVALYTLADMEKFNGTVIIATGYNYADALSIGPWAYKNSAPILLTNKKGMLTEEQVETAKEYGVTNAIIVGGDAVVSDAVADQLGVATTRLAGKNRYETSKAIAEWEIKQGMGLTNVTVTTGKNFPDALAGAPLCGKRSSVLLLAKDKDSAGLTLINSKAGVRTGYVLGGTAAVSEDLFSYLEGLTK